LSFLPLGEYTATIVADGRNADRYAADYEIESRTVGPRSSLVMELAPGGGYVARLVERSPIPTRSLDRTAGRQETSGGQP
jgi:alpha-glucosidase